MTWHEVFDDIRVDAIEEKNCLFLYHEQWLYLKRIAKQIENFRDTKRLVTNSCLFMLIIKKHDVKQIRAYEPLLLFVVEYLQ